MSPAATLHIAFDPIYAHPLPEGHRFPMLKYELIPAQLIYEGTISAHHLFSPTPCPLEDILRCHEAAYVQRLFDQTLSAKEQRAIGFPHSADLTLRECIITQGTIDCCYHALAAGVSLNVAGGKHHAFTDRGEGFCMLNDFAVAAHTLLYRKIVQKILIIDLDVHQGNGTAQIFQNDTRVFTLSMHGAHNYPFHKEKSDLDIPLDAGIEDSAYLSLLAYHLSKVLEEQKPDFAFYQSGVDILATDKFGKLSISKEGCKARDRMVFQMLKERGIPCTVAMGGGYSPDIKDITEAHCNTFRVAKEIFDLT